jgi:AraC family L-rhamnose operon regulatory protein RhaS
MLDMDWSLESMAKHCGMGRSQFNSYCRKLKNRTPMLYLTECRVNKAKRLLENQKSMNITEIGMECGFQSSQYFATQFRKQTGISPGEYRKQRSQLSYS